MTKRISETAIAGVYLLGLGSCISTSRYNEKILTDADYKKMQLKTVEKNYEFELNYVSFENALYRELNEKAYVDLELHASDLARWSEKIEKDGSSDMQIKNCLMLETEVFVCEKYVGVMENFWEYLGGAHGNYFYISHTADRFTGKEVSACEVTGFTKQQLADFCLKQLKESDQVYADLDELLFTEYIEQVPFAVDDKRLTLYFAPYEVAPYSAGTQYVVIPVEDWI